jgi:hypothetical protein
MPSGLGLGEDINRNLDVRGPRAAGVHLAEGFVDRRRDVCNVVDLRVPLRHVAHQAQLVFEIMQVAAHLPRLRARILGADDKHR